MKITIKDVAKKAGVSPGTVTRALNGYIDIKEETKLRILNVVQELGYVASNSARNLSAKTNDNIGVFVFGLMQEGRLNEFSNEVIHGVYNYLGNKDISVFVHFFDNQIQEEHRLKEFMDRYNINGVIMIGLKTGDYYLNHLEELKRPCVLIDVEANSGLVSSVLTNEVEAFYDITSYVLRKKHSDIILVYGRIQSEVALKRNEGFLKALEEFGITTNNIDTIFSDFSREETYQAVKDYILENKKNKNTTFVCMSDLTAIGVYKAVLELGYRIPEDFSVTGFDGIKFGECVFPMLTTVYSDFIKKGEYAAELLYKMIRSGKKQDSIYVPYKLIIRDSIS